MFAQLFENKKLLTFLSFSLLVSFCGVYITRDYVMDDALITLRYSYNFAELGIPIWNQADLGNPSMGYTSFLWMAINTLPALFIQNKEILVVFAQVFSLMALIGIVILISQEIFDLSMAMYSKYIVVLLIFSQFGYGLHVNSGMETLLFSLFMLLTVRAHARNNYKQAYILGLLLFLTRPEGIILVGIMGVWDLLNRRINQAIWGGVFFSIFSIGVLFLLFSWYGDVLPNPFYIKQGNVVNEASLKQTFFFLGTLASPFLILSVYAIFVLKNKVSIYMFSVALIYILYYTTVTPLMNVFSRYQWPSLVLLVYASIPSITFFATNSKKYILQKIVLVSLIIITIIGNNLGASYFATTTGYAAQNLVVIGKKMSEFRDPEKWLIYHDAGAICYFSDWNTLETIGLTNKTIAKNQMQVVDLYKNKNVQIVLQNFDLSNKTGDIRKQEFTELVAQYGYQHVTDIPTLFVAGQRNFVVAVYSRDIDYAKRVFENLNTADEMYPNVSFWLYSFVKKLVKGH